MKEFNIDEVTDLKQLVFNNLNRNKLNKNWLMHHFGLKSHLGLKKKLEKKSLSPVEIEFLLSNKLLDI